MVYYSSLFLCLMNITTDHDNDQYDNDMVMSPLLLRSPLVELHNLVLGMVDNEERGGAIVVV